MEYQSNNNGKSSASQQGNFTVNRILNGDCIQVMRELPAGSVDFILTDPPYLVNYCDRSGRSAQDDKYIINNYK